MAARQVHRPGRTGQGASSGQLGQGDRSIAAASGHQLGLKNPNVSSAITGASRVEQVRDNMKAIDAVARLTPDVMEHIEEILGNYKRNLN